MQGSVGSQSTVNQRRVPAGGWARKSSPRPESSPRLHRATSVAVSAVPPQVSPRPPSVLPTEGLPWCRTTNGFRRRFSYVVAFEVDLAGIVVAGEVDSSGTVAVVVTGVVMLNATGQRVPRAVAAKLRD